jgi:hypothetical protein
MHSASETERFALASAGIQLLVRVRLWHAEVSRVELDARNRFKTKIINQLPLDGHDDLHIRVSGQNDHWKLSTRLDKHALGEIESADVQERSKRDCTAESSRNRRDGLFRKT